MNDRSATTETPVLSWDADATEVPIHSEQELLERLHGIAAEAGETPPLVELFQPDGSSLAVGLGRDHSVVSYIRSVNEPDAVSQGTLGRDDSPLFYYHGAPSEFAPGTAVSVSEAIDAMLSFYRTGERPDNIDWRPS
jgi:Immunity protein Imm1